MNCPNCDNTMTTLELNEDLYYVCNNDICMADVSKRFNRPFVMICYDCRHKEHLPYPSDYAEELE